MKYDLKELKESAAHHMQDGNYHNALKIYYAMADGNPSLDGGYLGKQMALCCEKLGHLRAAKYWYGRAIEENPKDNADCAEGLRRLGDLPLGDLVFRGLSPWSGIGGSGEYDFNDLEESAGRHIEEGRYHDALKIYFYMADGDPSLDGGYLGGRIGVCYELLNDPHAAKYWHGRAIEENPEVRLDSVEAQAKLGDLPLDDLLFRHS